MAEPEKQYNANIIPEEKLQNRTVTKEKQYPTNIWGALKYGWDYLFGDTTYEDNGGYTINDQHGSPSTDTRTAYERNEQYLNPWGYANKNWISDFQSGKSAAETNWNWIKNGFGGMAEQHKASMSNGTNPLVGLNNTVVPAAAGAVIGQGAVALGGKAISAAPNFFMNTVPAAAKYVVSNPGTAAQKALGWGWKLAKPLVKGTIGGEAVDAGLEATTGKNWGENIAPYLGWSEEAASFTNPGFALGGIHWGISDAFKNNKLGKIAVERADYASREYSRLYDAKQNLPKVSPPDPLKAKSETTLERNKKFREALFSPRMKVEEYDIAFNMPAQTISLSGGEGTQMVEFPIKFTNAQGVTTNSKVFAFPRDVTSLKSQRFIVSHNPSGEFTLYPDAQISASKLQRYGTIFDSNSGGIREQVTKYVDDLNARMGEDGAVAGSSVHHRNGIFAGTETDSGLIGPADTEIYTTAARQPALEAKLQFQRGGTNSTGGAKGTSPYTFRNNDASHVGRDTEINIIEADADGNATGKIAHQIYRALYPDEYSKMMYDYTMAGNQVPFTQTKLPITAEELFQKVRSDPAAMEQHLLTDLVGMETFTNPSHTKHTKRLYSALFNDTEGVPQQLYNAMRAHGRYNMGTQFKLGSELYPNMSFADIEANKQFLKNAYNLSEEEATRFASNPDVMRNAFNLYNFSHSTGVRQLHPDVITARTTTGAQWHDPKIELMTGNGSFGGGNAAGNGLNRILLNPYGGWGSGDAVTSVTQSPLTFYPERIKTPMDLYKQVEKLKGNSSMDPRFEASDLTFGYVDRSVPIKYDTKRIKEIQDLAKAEDTPVNFGHYGDGIYSGSYTEPISAGVARVDFRNNLELGSLFTDMRLHSGMGPSTSIPYSDLPLKFQNEVAQKLQQASGELTKIQQMWNNMSISDKINYLSSGKRFGWSARDIPLGTPEITLRVPINAKKLVPQYDMPGHITYDLRQYNLSPGTVTDTERKEAQRAFQKEVEKYQQKKKDYRNYLQERKRLKQEMGKQKNEQYWHQKAYSRTSDSMGRNIRKAVIIGTGVGLPFALLGFQNGIEARRKQSEALEQKRKNDNKDKRE